MSRPLKRKAPPHRMTLDVIAEEWVVDLIDLLISGPGLDDPDQERIIIEARKDPEYELAMARRLREYGCGNKPTCDPPCHWRCRIRPLSLRGTR
jgi:hypothetical protein